MLSLTITLFFASLHYNEKLYDDRTLQLKWMNLFLELPVCALLPLLPMMFPIMWISINLWGIARLETHLAQPQPHIKIEQQKSFQEDLDTPTFEYETLPLPLKQVFSNWLSLWCGYSMLLGRSANIVQVLGSITALCCVDKKGILSWPNPTAEKIFFLRDSADQKTRTQSESTINSEMPPPTNGVDKSTSTITKEINNAVTPAKGLVADGTGKTSGTKSARIIDHKEPGTIAEVLDLTHDQHSPFRIDFDDHSWKTYIDSLKPLGNITLNLYIKKLLCFRTTKISIFFFNPLKV